MSQSLKIFLFVLMATVFEAAGDTVVRLAIQSPRTPVRVGFFVLGTALLAAMAPPLTWRRWSLRLSPGCTSPCCLSCFN